MSLTLEQIQDFKGKYPRQIWSLFFSEMWERFCFYGMRGMLVFFMIHQLNFAEVQANLQYGATQAFVYAFTFVGGLFADKILGFRKSLFWGGSLMIVGSVLLAIDPHKFFFFGLAFIIIGTGFFKPNISTMVGELYKEGDHRTDAGFSLFYAGINLGAFLGGYICVAIGKGYMLSSVIEEPHRWNVAFGLAAVGMLVSLINFNFTKRRLGPIGLQPGHPDAIVKSKPLPKWAEYAVYAGTLLLIPLIQVMVSKTEYTDYFMYTIGPLTLLYLFYEMTKVTIAERKKLIAALVFILFSIIFWGIYEQSGGSLSIFAAKNLNDSLMGITVDPNGVNNSGGAFFIILLAPLLGLLWIWLGKKKIEPNTIIKFGLGFIFLGLGYYVLFATRFFSTEGISSLNIFTLALLVITFGELCLSPIGLSIMTKLAPAKLQGIMMGMWFLASAYGQYVAGLIGASMAETKENAGLSESLIAYTEGYKMLGIYALIAGVVLILLSPVVKKLMQEVR
ncbi:amino acid transporter [Elizabethkingia meningoseptica]|uniref:MFS transporter n=1 Tax=Elizabethkingia meningoseptica TaxID=238 RepID=A0A1V3U1S5_ELIME|nr:MULTISPECIES: peptide MFS transporter [Elizabethkingia]AQX14005.1 amino acid transporter [Elizabethkingia meningoseptica]MBG0515823.1 peptide MFS transporter [Elizabethkingia meningoseptica]MDE5433810.1 peptide MFS transporter [Elizabethkingia meningoseptica]MDE5449951.1 peptide MFS transporter [Elizabethkingia meningoseptica]MDE5470085.1 peptide MFS transporter [Elizabethkingia meningoseptica]